MQVQVNPQWRRFIEAKVASGEFASADEVVDAAMQQIVSLQSEDCEICDRSAGPRFSAEEFREFLSAGLAQAEAGLLVPADLDEIRRRGRERLAARGVTSGP